MILALLAVLFAWLRWRKLTMAAALSSAMIIFLCGFTTLGAVILLPLEDRFPARPELAGAVDGIVVLGGYMNGEINAARGGIELNSAADRIVETMRLARLYPEARIVVSGGEGTMFTDSAPDAVSTRTILADAGLANRVVIYEGMSRNTVENAVFSRELAGPKPGEVWLLVTSAYHMPRSVGSFRKAGFPVIAWPVDFKAAPNTGFTLYLQSPDDAFSRTAAGIREWIGLASYYLSGKSDVLFPAP